MRTCARTDCAVATLDACAAGPFASEAGVGRAEPEWAALNLVKGIVGQDDFANSGETSEAPLPLPPVRHRPTSRSRSCVERLPILSGTAVSIPRRDGLLLRALRLRVHSRSLVASSARLRKRSTCSS